MSGLEGDALQPPYVVAARVGHRRSRPFDYAFRHRTTMWLVDVAEPNAAFPVWLRPLARIRSRDHLAEGDARLADKVRRYLRANDLPWSADRVLLLANVRGLGYVFDPLSTFFCLDATGRVEGVLAEVHNTYGERHVYPLAAGADETLPSVEKRFYVSPFLTVHGRYDIRARLRPDRVHVTVSLTQDGDRVFSGSVSGRLEPATRRRVLAALARDPAPSLRVAALIRLHGIRLWLRRLPVVPRRPHQTPRGLA